MFHFCRIPKRIICGAGLWLLGYNDVCSDLPKCAEGIIRAMVANIDNARVLLRQAERFH